VIEFSKSWRSAADALIWMSFYAGFLASGRERIFFLQVIGRNAVILNISKYAEVETVLDTFLYRRPIFSRPFLDLWDEVVTAGLLL
jgi:hypothetical protein